MEWWLQLGASALTGTVFGVIASVGSARQIARSSERGRAEEQARQRLVEKVQLFRAHVALDRSSAAFKSAMDEDYLSAEKRLAFAQDIEADLGYVPVALREAMRVHIETLCGPVDARSARLAGPVSLAKHDREWRVWYYVRQAQGLTDEQVEDAGLLGKARDAELVGQHVLDVIAELDRMEDTLDRWGRSGKPLTRRLALPWRRS